MSHLATKSSHRVTQPAESHETTRKNVYDCGTVAAAVFPGFRSGIWYCFNLR